MISVEVSLPIDVTKKIKEIDGALNVEGEINDLLNEISTAILTDIDLAFRSETSPDGAPWAQLSDTTKEGRRRGGRSAGDQVLRDTGVLASSFLSLPASGGEVKVGSIDVRAGTHHYGAARGSYGSTKRGAPIPWGDIPARPLLPDPEGAALGDLIEETVTDWLSRR